MKNTNWGRLNKPHPIRSHEYCQGRIGVDRNPTKKEYSYAHAIMRRKMAKRSRQINRN